MAPSQQNSDSERVLGSKMQPNLWYFGKDVVLHNGSPCQLENRQFGSRGICNLRVFERRVASTCKEDGLRLLFRPRGSNLPGALVSIVLVECLTSTALVGAHDDLGN